MAPVEHLCGILESDTITQGTLAPLLRTAVLGRVVVARRECDSTNNVARALIADGTGASGEPRNGTLIVTECQQAGRGRTGASWQSPLGASILMSLILYPARQGIGSPGRTAQSAALAPVPATPNLVTMAASLALVRALAQVGAAGCSIKWPNDVLAPTGGKLAGLLTETVGAPGGRLALVAGIGLNVNQRFEDFAPDLRDSASSARIVAGKLLSRLELLAWFLEAFEQTLALEDAALFEHWRNHCSTLGRRVRLRCGGEALAGEAVGIETDGSLLLRLPDGATRAVRSGDVREVRNVAWG